MKSIFKVIAQTEPQTINTQNGQTQKSIVVLQELGGKYENSFTAALIGNQSRFSPNALVYAALRFSSREYQGNWYQDITIQEIYPLSNR